MDNCEEKNPDGPPPPYPGPGQPQPYGQGMSQQPAPGVLPQQPPLQSYPVQQPGYVQPPPPHNPGYMPPAVPGQQPVYGQQPMYGQQPVFGQQTAYGAPQAPGYGGQQSTVIISQPTVAFGGRGSYGTDPCAMKCPYCSADVTTSTSRQCGGMVWMIAGIICLVGCFIPFVWLGCCLIPFCIPSLYDVKHTCPNCQRTLGTHSKAF